MAFPIRRTSPQVRLRLVAVTLALPALLTQPAHAQAIDDATRAAARKLGSAGLNAFQEHDYATASDKLGKAFHVLQAPSLGLWSARALEKLGKLVEAQERYVKVTRLEIDGGDAEVQKKARAEAATDLAALSPRIPSVVVQVEGTSPSEVRVTVDGTALLPDLVGEAWPVDPGPHHIVGTHGTERKEADVTVAEGEHPSTVLNFGVGTIVAAATPAAATPQHTSGPLEPASPQRGIRRPLSRTTALIAWVTLAGVGAASFGAVGAIAGVVTLVDRGGLHQGSDCFETSCKSEAADRVNSYNTMRTVLEHRLPRWDCRGGDRRRPAAYCTAGPDRQRCPGDCPGPRSNLEARSDVRRETVRSIHARLSRGRVPCAQVRHRPDARQPWSGRTRQRWQHRQGHGRCAGGRRRTEQPCGRAGRRSSERWRVHRWQRRR